MLTRSLQLMRDWLVECGVSRVGMESTSTYWKPVFYALEQDLGVWLLNSHHLKAVPGWKTDVRDAEWIVQLVEMGLVRFRKAMDLGWILTFVSPETRRHR